MNGATHFWFPARFVAPFLAWREVCAVVLDRRDQVKHKVTLRGCPWDKAKYFRVVEYKAASNHFLAYKLPCKPKAVYQFTHTDDIVRDLDAILHSELAVCGRGYHYANGTEMNWGWWEVG